MKSFVRILAGVSIICMTLNGCAEGIKTEASYPTRVEGTDKILYSDQKRETIWGEDETLTSRLFGKEKDVAASSGIGVNGFLWRAALDTVSFMPVASADPFGGVILTDWYEPPQTAGTERLKVNIYILDRQLRSDAVRVAVFRQVREKDGWRDANVVKDTGVEIENVILDRARQLRVAQINAK